MEPFLTGPWSKMTEFRSLLMLSVLVAAVHGAATFGYARADGDVPPAPREVGESTESALTADQIRDLAYDRTILLAPQQDREIRLVAAQRLLSMGIQPAYEALGEGLKSGNTQVIDAVITAMNAAERPISALLDPAVEALGTAPAEISDRLAFTLMRYGDQAISRIVTLARDRSLTNGARIGAVRTLGIVPSRESGAALMAIVNPANEESDALRQAAFESLRRLSTVEHDSNYGAWRLWWSDAQRKSREEWSAELVMRWVNRAAILERDSSALAARYVSLLRELYLERPLERQFERLPQDLADPLPQARLFALDRISVLVRDSIPIPDAVQEKVVACLDHPNSDIRRRASSLLTELDHPQLSALLATRLPGERSPQVARAWLDALALRPTAAAIEAALPWLQRSETSASAANAIWSSLNRTPPAEIDTEHLGNAAGIAYQTFPSPSAARLAAFLVNADLLQPFEAMLSGDDADLARNVAEGMAARRHTAPLLTNAGREAVLPFAIRAIVDELPTLEGLRLLLSIRPAEGLFARWEDAVRTIVRRLPPGELLDADDLLRDSPAVSDTLRETTLIAALLTDEPPPAADQIGQLLTRVLPLLIRNGASLRGYELLATFTVRASPDVHLDDLRLRLTLLVGRFDEAAGITSDIHDWLAVLEETAEYDPAGVGRLHAEIERRWADSLTPEDRKRLEVVASHLASIKPRTGNGGPNGSSR